MVSEKVSLTDRFLWICNTIFHQTYAVVTIFILWTLFYNQSLSSVNAWHYILSTLAYIPLMGEAIILFGSDNVWSRSMERSTKYWIHGMVLFVSAILVTVGIALMVDRRSSPHFQSLHGWTGFVSWIFVLLSQCLGLASAKAQSLSRIVKPVYVKFVHNFLGLLGYVFGIVSLAYGLQYGAFSRHTTVESRHATYWLLGITTAWSILAALKSGYGQLKTIFTSA